MLSGYEPQPGLTRYTNGRPLPTVGMDKKTLVVIALNRAMAKKCGCGLSGLGDDGSDADIQAISDAANAIEDTANQAASDTIDIGSGSSVPYSGPILVGSGPMTTIAGSPATPGAATFGQSLANALSSIFRPTGYSTVPAYGSTGFATPLYTGSPISTGGALLAAGGVVLVVLLLKRR